MKRLEAALHARLPERHLLDILCRVDHWVNWSRHFGPLSGSEPKMEDAKARQILTVFAYGTNLGPHQMARHLRGDITSEILAQVNRRHITAEKLDAANRDIINRFRRCTLPRCWGDEKRAAADGTQYDLAEENLVAEKHIRYGGFGELPIIISVICISHCSVTFLRALFLKPSTLLMDCSRIPLNSDQIRFMRTLGGIKIRLLEPHAMTRSCVK